MKRIVGWLLGLALLVPVSASATVITFDNLVATGDAISYGSSPFTIQGYTFTATAGQQFSLDPDYDLSNAPPNNTDFETFEGNPSFTMGHPTPFTLVSFRAAAIYDTPASTLTVTGNLSGGGTVVQAFAIPSGDPTAQWATYVLPAGFTGLSSVSFVFTGEFLGIDDVVVAGPSGDPPIPALDPMSLLALSTLLALAAFAFARRPRA